MNEHWAKFFSLPVSGNAKLLLLRVALEPYEESIEPRNVRAFCEELRLFVPEYERAFLELRDQRIALMTSPHHDKPQVASDSWARKLFESDPGQVKPKKAGKTA